MGRAECKITGVRVGERRTVSSLWMCVCVKARWKEKNKGCLSRLQFLASISLYLRALATLFHLTLSSFLPVSSFLYIFFFPRGHFFYFIEFFSYFLFLRLFLLPFFFFILHFFFFLIATSWLNDCKVCTKVSLVIGGLTLCLLYTTIGTSIIHNEIVVFRENEYIL